MSFDDDAVVRLDRDPASGALTPAGCVDDNDAPQGPDTCAQSADGLDAASSIAVSPDGESVYVAAVNDDAIVRLDRDPEDSDAPETTINSGPSGFTNDQTPTFAFSADEPLSSFQCRVFATGDPPPAFGPCSDPATQEHTPAALVDGTFTFEVIATDTEANTDAAPAARVFTVDSGAPAPPALELDTASPANENSPRLGGRAEEGSTVSIYTDPGCAGSPVATLSAFVFSTDGFTAAVVDDSTTNFSATATDGAGNTSSCSAALTYREDSTAPNATIKGPKTTTNRKPKFTLSADEAGATFSCKLDRGSSKPCNASFRPPRLGFGAHTLTVSAADEAGNTDPTSAVKRFQVKATKKR